MNRYIDKGLEESTTRLGTEEVPASVNSSRRQQF